MGNLNENYVMTTASGLSGFAILVSPNHLNQSSVSALQSQITALQGWNNSTVNAARVSDWVSRHSSFGAKYFETEMYGAGKTLQEKLSYWNSVIGLIGTGEKGVWVPFSAQRMCYVCPGTTMAEHWPDASTKSTYGKFGSVLTTDDMVFNIVLEHYTGTTVDNLLVNSGTAVATLNSLWNFCYDLYGSVGVLDAAYVALEARVRALEGN